jgi:hypothetical protein
MNNIELSRKEEHILQKALADIAQILFDKIDKGTKMPFIDGEIETEDGYIFKIHCESFKLNQDELSKL